ncbi:MAG TPA: 3-hydroxyacyl-CoA dehydrogenase [Caulobacteraceae bacterium]|jgi:3-hydroxyacyl-CoA dehydrogenase
MAKIAIIGSGLVGRSWAISFARAGHDAFLWDAEPGAAEAAIGYIGKVLPDLAANDLLRGSTPDQVLGRLHVATTAAAALQGAVYAQESTPERVEIKREVYAMLDAAADPDTILASSTTALLPSSFTEALAGRARCIVAHPINPPYVIPAVEVVPAPWTSPEVTQKTADLLRSIGHVPVVMQKELDGFLVNRLQGALLHEAFRLVAEGYAGVEDIDACLRDGLALRWSFMGPFETIDLNAPGGVRDYVARYGPAFARIAAGVTPTDWTGAVLDKVEAERRAALPATALAARTAWRDRRLMALAAHKQKATKDIGS